MNGKLKTIFEVVAVCTILSLATYGGVYLYNNLLNNDPFQPVRLFTSMLVKMGPVVQISNKLSDTILTFENNQTIDFQDYPYVISSLVLGRVYEVYLCNDGGYRVVQDS